MQFPHISGLDLKLIEPLYALLEERHVTRAARRCSASQSAMSRALERLRSAFDDDLLVRSNGAYERTPRGDQLLADLQDLLPRLDAAIRGNHFVPATSRSDFRIATTDYAASILIPKLLERIGAVAPHVRIEIVPWSSGVLAEIEAGRIHLAIIGVDGAKPLENEALFNDEFVCVVADGHPLRSTRVPLKRYLEFAHAVIAIADGGQPWIERALAARGFTRRVGYRTPYQVSAIVAASQSAMICTMARRCAMQLAAVANVRVLAAPRELPVIAYRMAWHRRLRDDAAQSWLRQQIRLVAKTL